MLIDAELDKIESANNVRLPDNYGDVFALLAEVRRLRAEAAPVLTDEEIAALKQGDTLNLNCQEGAIAVYLWVDGVVSIVDEHLDTIVIPKADRKRLAAALLVEREVTP